MRKEHLTFDGEHSFQRSGPRYCALEDKYVPLKTHARHHNKQKTSPKAMASPGTSEQQKGSLKWLEPRACTAGGLSDTVRGGNFIFLDHGKSLKSFEDEKISIF